MSTHHATGGTDSGGSDGSGGETTGTGDTTGVSGDTSAPGTQCGALHNTPSTYRVELCVPDGTFSMGSNTAYAGLSGHMDHRPAHEVTLSSFLIDAYEVTVGRYRACVEAGACGQPGLDATRCTYTQAADASENLPMSCVTAGQASTFCQWDGSRRLPTEAEWERTAAGTESSVYPWGNAFDCSKAAIGSTVTCAPQYSKPVPVGSLAGGKSAAGAYDMAGNLAEWVNDFASAYSSEPVTNPEGPSTGTIRIIRGGGYRSTIDDGQTFVRSTSGSSTIGAIGFRCARSAGS